MGHCNGHGEVQGHGCECDRLYYGSTCQNSFRDATGWAFVVFQVLTVIPHVILVYSTLRQLMHVYARRDLKLGVQLLLFVSCTTLLAWLFDPYGLGGQWSTETALVLLVVGTIAMLMASTVTVIHWRQLLHTTKLSKVLEGRHLYVCIVFWVVVLALCTVLVLHFVVTRDPRDVDLLNGVLVAILLSQTIVLGLAAIKLRALVRSLGPSRVARLANLAHAWSLLGAAGAVMTVGLVGVTAVGLDDEPWVWFAVNFGLGRATTLLMILVLYASTAGTPVPTAQRVMRAVLRILFLWLPRNNNILPMTSAPVSESPPPAPADAQAPTGLAGPSPDVSSTPLHLNMHSVLAPGLAPGLAT